MFGGIFTSSIQGIFYGVDKAHASAAFGYGLQFLCITSYSDLSHAKAQTVQLR